MKQTKSSITIRLDTDVLIWIEHLKHKLETDRSAAINAILRQAKEDDENE